MFDFNCSKNILGNYVLGSREAEGIDWLDWSILITAVCRRVEG